MEQAFQLEILPKIGLNSFKFGANSTDALKLFGDPEETENLKDEVLNANSLVYHYWEKGFSLFFNANSNLIFTCAEIDNPGSLLFGEKIFDLSEEEIVKLFEKNGYKMTETEDHEWGEKRVSFDDALIDLYFENDELSSINFGLFPEESTFFYFPN
ncbi:MAG: hypothetical protein ACJ76F_08985 [Bacteroidia bacterium]